MKKIIILGLSVALLLSSCATKDTSGHSAVDGVYEYGVVTQAVGNELTLELGTVAEQSPFEGPNSKDIPSGESSFKKMPNMEGGERPDFSQMPKDTNQESRADGNGGTAHNGINIEKTGEVKSYTVNVNTPVYMEIGSKRVETTFSKIQNGDILKLTMESDTIMSVSILGQEVADGSN